MLEAVPRKKRPDKLGRSSNGAMPEIVDLFPGAWEAFESWGAHIFKENPHKLKKNSVSLDVFL